MTATKVFVSYSWAVEAQEETAVIEKLELHCKSRNIQLVYDQKHLKHGQAIEQFMENLASNERVLLLLSDRYFKSRWCMYELKRICDNRHCEQKIHMLIVDDCGIRDNDDYHAELIQYWKNELTAANERFPDGSEVYRHLRLFKDIENHIHRLLTFVSKDNIYLLERQEQEDFAPLLDGISQPVPDFIDEVIQEVAKLLRTNGDAVKKLIKKLADELNQSFGSTTENTDKAVAKDLVNYLREDAENCDVINKVLTNSAEYLLDKERATALVDQAERHKLHHILEGILGYLVLSLVDLRDAKDLSDWLTEDDVPGRYFELYMNKRGGVEIFIAQQQKRPATFVVEKRDTPGQRMIFIEPEIMSWKEDEKINNILLEVWMTIFEEEPGAPLDPKKRKALKEKLSMGEREKRELKAELNTFSRIDSPDKKYCIAIPFENDWGESYREKCKEFVREFNIPLIHFDIGGDHQAFGGSELSIISALRNFITRLNQIA